MSRGKLIVIDGTDGSGKATQTDLLLERLKKEGYACSKIDFPQYGAKSAGLIENYLNGKYGSPDELNPYIASFFYSLDRYDASFSFKNLLDNGEIIISNRYTSSNMGHQGSKFSTPESRRLYFEWLDIYEHKVFKIPRPDLTIILHVPPEYAQNLLEKKAAREYINGEKRDLLESDLGHQHRAEQTYLEMCQLFPNYELVECVRDGEIMSVEAIHELVWERVSGLVN
ncbi:MAG: thymidylate kinase [Candidatus Komeilibacteria bacterium]|nr:thymidylate kinase [Candidatus Komeilibacteria bacterium]